jgi:uncharacterized protein DUF1566
MIKKIQIFLFFIGLLFFSCDFNTLGNLKNQTIEVDTADTEIEIVPTVYAVRDIGPAGGFIFYDKGSYSDGWRYLETAPSDQDYENNYNIEWGCQESLIESTNAVVGTGYQNTMDIINDCTLDGIAAQRSSILSINGFDDWFLPSKDELNLIYNELHCYGVGGFIDFTYWSSTEKDSISTWNQNFTNGIQASGEKGTFYRVRAVRSF